MTRADKARERRRLWHEARIEAARTPKARLWAACGWLVAEAWRLGRTDEAVEAVLSSVHNIREQEVSHDRDAYRA